MFSAVSEKRKYISTRKARQDNNKYLLLVVNVNDKILGLNQIIFI